MILNMNHLSEHRKLNGDSALNFTQNNFRLDGLSVTSDSDFNVSTRKFAPTLTINVNGDSESLSNVYGANDSNGGTVNDL